MPDSWLQAGDGTFHLFVHGNCGYHAFSEDGLAWHTAPHGGVTCAFPRTQVPQEGGAPVRVGRRERPHLVLGADGWTPVALSTSVTEGSADYSYTLVQASDKHRHNDGTASPTTSAAAAAVASIATAPAAVASIATAPADKRAAGSFTDDNTSSASEAGRHRTVRPVDGLAPMGDSVSRRVAGQQPNDCLGGNIMQLSFGGAVAFISRAGLEGLARFHPAAAKSNVTAYTADDWRR